MSTTITAAATTAAPKAGRLKANLFANVAQLALSLLVGVWYVPFLVRELGPAAYGLIPLTSVITSYMTLITIGLESAVGRFETLALSRDDHQSANLMFNVALWGNVALCALLLIPAIIAVAQADRLIRIPPGYETATRWLFAGTIAAFLLNQIKTPFTVSFFCRNRLDLQNMVTAGETLTRVGLVVLLFVMIAARVEYVGAAILAGTLVAFVGTILAWRSLTPTLFVSWRLFDWGMLRKLCHTGGWVVVSQIGVMLYLNIDLLVANRLFGAEQSGKYAAVLQLPFLLRSLSLAVGGVFAPTMFHIYARDDIGGLVVYLRRSIKFLGFFLALPIGLTCGFAKPLLQVWLGNSFAVFAPLLVVMTIHLCINLAMYPLYPLPLALNRVKVPGLVTLAVGVGNVLLALFLAGEAGWGLYGIAAAGGIMLTTRHLLFTPLYSAHILKQPWTTFYRGVGGFFGATLLTAGFCQAIMRVWPIGSWLELALASGIISILFLIVAYALLTPAERIEFKETIGRRKSRPTSACS
ncbi:MAG TPA: oligosaccharide flippase family protein [Candidatus Limnocylindrales bacterium]|jgi:membrane protein EpsK|nr:oligosaccharide flippase family protein [Candidatus Limnocylindrales bacterium]